MRFIYHFDDEIEPSSDLLGGKGRALLEMRRLGIPVPDGFVISTYACKEYFDAGQTFSTKLRNEIEEAISLLEERSGTRLGDAINPMIVSVRSGAKISMPGMMDTILNFGLNRISLNGLIAKTGDESFAFDSYRRFLQMYGNIVLGIPHSVLEAAAFVPKDPRKIDNIKKTVALLEDIIKKATGRHIVDEDPRKLLLEAIEAVFCSWNGRRAIKYREIRKIPHDGGTAVNIQLMVFGNMHGDSGTGVAFTRDPSTGEKKFYGEFMQCAQGEDIVSGTHTPLPISGKNVSSMESFVPGIFKEFCSIASRLEGHYRDMQDIEFTIENGKLWILQSRSGKRSSKAAIKIAIDLIGEGVISTDEAMLRVGEDQVNNFLHKDIHPKFSQAPIAQGLPASPGAACGAIAFTSEAAEKLSSKGAVILCREETSPEDIDGFHISDGILTIRGGMTSHAAVVARGIGKPCVCGVEDAFISNGKIIFGDSEFFEGDVITIDGTSGRIFGGVIELQQTELSDYFWKFINILDEKRSLGIRANAETEKDVSVALKFGAEGVGLCRTEHMFLECERLYTIREIILCQPEKRGDVIDRAMKLQVEDFISLYKLLEQKPISIRLLDPPLHEFLPKNSREIAEFSRKSGIAVNELENKIEHLKEHNPMLGHRGCRIAITSREIYEMQIRAIFEAASYVRRNFGFTPAMEIMIPLVSLVEELLFTKRIVQEVASDFSEIQYKFGAMIETPRAVIISSKIGKHVDFCSFGTNDLTQMSFGISRDDSYKFINKYKELKILDNDPFVSIDIEGVGEFMKMSLDALRRANPDIKVGVCGEHGGDGKSISFFHDIGFDYVSCSPYRIPSAKLAAAKSAVMHKIHNEYS